MDFDLMALLKSLGGSTGGTGYGGAGTLPGLEQLLGGSMGGRTASQDPQTMGVPQTAGDGVTPAAAVKANLANQMAQMQAAAQQQAANEPGIGDIMKQAAGLIGQFKNAQAQPVIRSPGEQHPPVMARQPGAPGWPPQGSTGLLGGATPPPVNRMALGPLGAGPSDAIPGYSATRPPTVDRRYMASVGSAPRSSLRDLLPELANQVAIQESGGVHFGRDGKPKRNRKSGAIGLMQILPENVHDMGFGVPSIDPAELADPVVNKHIGTEYLGGLLDYYDNVTDALAAYNWGPTHVDDWLAKGGRWNALPKETQDYINDIQRMMGNRIA